MSPSSSRIGGRAGPTSGSALAGGGAGRRKGPSSPSWSSGPVDDEAGATPRGHVDPVDEGLGPFDVRGRPPGGATRPRRRRAAGGGRGRRSSPPSPARHSRRASGPGGSGPRAGSLRTPRASPRPVREDANLLQRRGVEVLGLVHDERPALAVHRPRGEGLQQLGPAEPVGLEPKSVGDQPVEVARAEPRARLDGQPGLARPPLGLDGPPERRLADAGLAGDRDGPPDPGDRVAEGVAGDPAGWEEVGIGRGGAIPAVRDDRRGKVGLHRASLSVRPSDPIAVGRSVLRPTIGGSAPPA